MVTEYIFDRCRYLAGSLKPFIYIIPKEGTRIDYLIDNHKCEVKQIYFSKCIKIEGFKTMLTVTETVDNRLDFATKVTLSMRENWGEAWVALLNQLKTMNVYVVVEDYSGAQYIQTPEFTSFFQYTYDFNTGSNQGHIAEIIYSCDCNMPIIILNNKIGATQSYGNDCAYQDGGIRNLRMTPFQYVFIDNNAETGQFTTITCTGGEAMHKIEFSPESFQFRQQYDGRQYQERLTFRIPLSDYKYYFRYNLIEFRENRYAITFETSQGNWIASGFEFGMQPTYTIETSESVEELNFIEITLQHAGQNSIFFCSDRTPAIIDSTTEIYIPVTQPIKDPITGLMLNYWHCTSKTESIYTLIQMVTESGIPTDRYMCLKGYEEYYSHFNIIGTYDKDAKFDFSLTFPNYDCAIKDNCKFSKMTKEVYSFSKIGDNYDVHIQNPCPWTLNDIPSWIDCDRLSGDGGIDYVVHFTSKENATDQRKISFSYLQSFDNISTIQFILENRVNWLNPVEHHITAMGQTVTTYVNLDYEDYDVCEIPYGLEAQKIRGTSTIKIKVPENDDESAVKIYKIGVCNTLSGEKGYIYIYQDHIYTRWVEDVGNYICVNGTSYQRVIKYKGYTKDSINILTDVATTGAKLIEADPRCLFDDSDGELYGYQWRDIEGTICDNFNLYKKQIKWESNDGGVTWSMTSEYRKGELIEEGSSECQEEKQKSYKYIIDESKYDCYGTSSYYMECMWWTYDNLEWYKAEPEQCKISTTLRKENDTKCGGEDIVPGYNERWEQSNETYCKDGFLYYLLVKYVSNDGGITWTVTNDYKESNINSGVECDSSDRQYVWRIDKSTYVCDGYNSYYVEKYYYYYNSNPSVYILVEPLQTRMSTTIKTANDPNCGYVDPRIYRWNTETGETICRGDDLYTREDYEVSTDNGKTWTKTGQYRIGTLVEKNSETCMGQEKIYKYEIDNTRWVCVGTTSYYYEVRYESSDGGNTWVKSDPEVIQQSTTVRLQNDPECGSSNTIYRWIDDGDNYICEEDDSAPIENTRWVLMPRSSWICDGYYLMSMEKQQITTNGGLTWSDNGNIRQGGEIIPNATECADVNQCSYKTTDFEVSFYCDGSITTNKQEIYNDYRIIKAEWSTDYKPNIRLVTSSPQGSNWFTVTQTVRTIGVIDYTTFKIDIPNNQDTGTIICYWEIYNRANNEILHTTNSWTITRNNA